MNPQTAWVLHTTPEREEFLLNVHLFVFDNFATGTEEVATEFGISRDSARKALKRCEQLGTLSGEDWDLTAQGDRRQGEYKEITWQSWQSYDYITREESIQEFKRAWAYAEGENS